jgi:molybdopterin synthase sulfur carrier subunit
VAVEVRVTSVLQRVVGAKSVEADGGTVAEVLEQINSKYPGFREQITMEDGSLHRFVNIYINDEDIRFMQSLDTPVSAGDVVSILPALAGGSGVQAGGHPQAPAEGCAPGDDAGLALRHPGVHR